jgi:hypothetical protein
MELKQALLNVIARAVLIQGTAGMLVRFGYDPEHSSDISPDARIADDLRMLKDAIRTLEELL